ncbi:MAG: urea carboxylase-associated family protein [Catenulispora sp.]|nr:urea carboxylase-associated family protein [Catenulispora sp.]
MRSETIPAKSGRAWRVAAGRSLRVVDVDGGQTGDLFAVAADDPADGQSNGRTFDYGGTLRLSTGSVLYSRRSRPLLRIAEDEVGTHDFLYAPCSQQMYEIEYAATGPRPNCFDNLVGALAAFGVPASTVTTAFNVFMNVGIAPDGGLTVLAPASAVAGRGTTFVAERDLFVAVTSCPASNCNGGRAQRLVVELL